MERMASNILSPRQALNKAFLKVRPSRDKIDVFKTNLRRLLANINEIEREENQKNHIRDFLRDTYYRDSNEVNTKGTIDLAIHLGTSGNDRVGVILEAKRPSNRSEMMSKSDLNTKAMQELVLYYLRERISSRNLEVKFLVATNVYEWFIFDATLFERYFASDKTLVAQFLDFEAGRLGSKDTLYFYKNVAQVFVENVKSNLTYTHFDLRDYGEALSGDDKTSDRKLISLYKILSPEHILKLPFANDSNQLDEDFYDELLHIIGLVEVREGTRKVIRRLNEAERDPGSLLEMTLFQVEDEQIPDTFAVSLELVITWVNRILFLKLLEAQLLRYHKDDQAYSFMNTESISGLDELNNLFFKVLAVKPNLRHGLLREKYIKVPYLNSSLFEKTELEEQYFPISQLTEGVLKVYTESVLKDVAGRRRTGSLGTLDYFFQFLDAYDFSSEGSEDIQEKDRSLISASVLGLIFEKINGYKDGAYFTPGFVTMYMSRESIRNAILNRFNQAKQWQVESFSELYNAIQDNQEARYILDGLTVCDPAVGSGHFLVSALNELIVAKSELGLLVDSTGKRLKSYEFSVINDELVVNDEDDILFSYNPKNHESRLVQEAIFEEKRRIIENCLFGVDINENSVKICRLRLWIELLKSSYYTKESDFLELETLPNIDINIKCGNSLVSKFDIKSDLRGELKKLKFSVSAYRDSVQKYKNASSKDEKRQMENLIHDLKSRFQAEVEQNDKRVQKRSRLLAELAVLGQGELFDLTQSEQSKSAAKRETLIKAIAAVEAEIDDIRSNAIYEDSFEWRFEFPEVLDNDGDFVGFDVVIGNPPYGTDIDRYVAMFEAQYPKTSHGFKDIYKYFFDRAISLARSDGYFCLITPNTFLRQPRYRDLRQLLLDNTVLQIIDLGEHVFDAVVPTAINLGQVRPVRSNMVRYADISRSADKVTSLYDYDPVHVDQQSFRDSRGFVFLPQPSSRAVDSLTLNDVLEFKDAGINYQRVGVGLADKGNSDLSARLLYEGDRESDTDVEYWKGTDIDRYYVASATGRWCRTGIPTAENERVILNGKYFQIAPKLIWRQTASTPIVALDTRGIWFGRSIQGGIIKPDFVHRFSYLFLCGYLNSRYVQNRYEESVRESGRVFPQVKLEKLKALPIAVPRNDEKVQMETLVAALIQTREAGGNIEEIDALQKTLDNLVEEFMGRATLE